MTDIGEGILSTLKKKFSQVIKELVMSNNKDILYRAFEKKYTSATKDIDRDERTARRAKTKNYRNPTNLVRIQRRKIY